MDMTEEGKAARKRIRRFLMSVCMWRNDVLSVEHPHNGTFILDCSDLVTIIEEVSERKK